MRIAWGRWQDARARHVPRAPPVARSGRPARRLYRPVPVRLRPGLVPDRVGRAGGADAPGDRHQQRRGDGLQPLRRGSLRPRRHRPALELYWLEGYGGGLFVPFADATSGRDTYGAGRYLLDTVKGADLGQRDGRLVMDFNFAYQPSCAYDPRWTCPLAPPANRLSVAVRAGERVARKADVRPPSSRLIQMFPSPSLAPPWLSLSLSPAFGPCGIPEALELQSWSTWRQVRKSSMTWRRSRHRSRPQQLQRRRAPVPTTVELLAN